MSDESRETEGEPPKPEDAESDVTAESPPGSETVEAPEHRDAGDAPDESAGTGGWSSSGWTTGPAADEPEQSGRSVRDPAAGTWTTTRGGTAVPAGGAPVSAEPPAPSVGRALTAVVGGVVGAVLAVVALLFMPGTLRRSQQRPSPTSTAAPSGRAGADLPALAREARPWVVSIESVGELTGAGGPAAFTRFGSGLVIRPDGVIATTARIVDGAKTIKVTFAYGRSVEASLVASDGASDVAVIRVQARELPTAVLGTAEIVELAEPVVAVTSPSGVQSIVQTGSIAGFGRTVDGGDGKRHFDLLQIDAPLGSGGGGGVVMGSAGAAIGLTSSLQDASGRIGYAIPIDVVRSVAQQLIDGGKASNPWLGIVADPLDAEAEARLDTRGLVVVRVFDGPAARQVRTGDIIVDIDGRGVEGPLSLLKRVLERKVNDELTLRVLREGEQVEVKVKVSEQP